VDTSALVAGIASQKGAAREILRFGEAGIIEIIVSKQVLVETRRTFAKKLPSLAGGLDAYLRELALTVVDDPARPSIDAAEIRIRTKDAPILAAAEACGASFLVTWDRRDFILRREAIQSAAQICTPAEFLALYRAAVS